MTLLSDSSMNVFPSNKQAEFTVKLDRPIEIDEETLEVALAEIATPSEVLNITEENNFFFLAFPDQHSLYTKFGVENITEMCSNDSGDYYKFKLKIPTGNYMSPKYLVEEMQASIDKFEKGILKHVNAYVSITYDALNQRLKVSAQNERQVRIVFPNQFAQILGLDPTMIGKPIGNEENTFKFTVNLHNNFRSLYVYSDIASFTFIGDTVAPLLRIVPFSHNSNSLSICIIILEAYMFTQTLQVSLLLVILWHLFYVLCHFLIIQKQVTCIMNLKHCATFRYQNLL